MGQESLEEFVDHIIEDGIITTEEHDKFMELVHADGEIDAEESALISKIFKLIQSGQVKVVDKDREAVSRQEADEVKQAALEADLELERERDELKAKLAEEQSSKEAAKKKAELAKTVRKIKRDMDSEKNKINEYFEKREQAQQEQEKEEQAASSGTVKNKMLKRATDKFHNE
jgi:hypothetical protein